MWLQVMSILQTREAGTYGATRWRDTWCRLGSRFRIRSCSAKDVKMFSLDQILDSVPSRCIEDAEVYEGKVLRHARNMQRTSGFRGCRVRKELEDNHAQMPQQQHVLPTRMTKNAIKQRRMMEPHIIKNSNLLAEDEVVGAMPA